MDQSYQLKTENFEGPFPLLLELIEKDKLDITTLSLSRVADDYLAYIENNQQVNLANLSEFLYIASQLILLKSKALLPLFEFTQEEEEEIGNLEERLREYQRYKKAAGFLITALRQKLAFFSKDEEKSLAVIFTPPKINGYDLRKLYIKVLDQIPKHEELAQEVVQEVISLEEKISHLHETLEKRIQVAFHETIADAKDKIDVIVTFLALLEMVKQKVVSVQQDDLFGTIMMERRDGN